MKRFVKKVENFICEKCGREVKGNGFTNHCPTCLWSKHVDENPGDRASLCKGAMEPFSVSQKSGKWLIHHKCVSCGFKKIQTASAEDNFEKILFLAATEISD